MKRKCQHCTEAFTPKRSDAKFCSPRCRVYANRIKRNIQSVTDDSTDDGFEPDQLTKAKRNTTTVTDDRTQRIEESYRRLVYQQERLFPGIHHDMVEQEGCELIEFTPSITIRGKSGEWFLHCHWCITLEAGFANDNAETQTNIIGPIANLREAKKQAEKIAVTNRECYGSCEIERDQ